MIAKITVNTLFAFSDEWQAIRDNWPAFEQSPSRSKVRLENAPLRLIRQRELVDFAVEWMEKNRK